MAIRTFSAALCLGIVTSLAACAPASVSSGGDVTQSHGRPIVGGTAASDYPEAVLVDLYQGGQLFAYCSGTLIAPSVVLTAGHCVHGADSWQITAPNAGGQTANSSGGTTYDWNTDSEDVDPSMHDLGLIFLSSSITLSSYPTVASSPLSDGSQVVNIGRIDNGQLSTTDLYESQPLTVSGASNDGFPFDYIANEIIQPGDSGGPDMAAGTHTLVAVNSGAGGGTEVLARVDLLASWIQQQVAANGGGGNPGGGNGNPGGGNGAGGSGPGGTPGNGGGGGAGGGGDGSGQDICGGVTYEGDCQGDVVEWCDDNGVEQLDCSQYGMTCGWDDADGFYNCI
jgi:hypothetical protein